MVGGLAEKPRAVPVFPEYDFGFILNELETFENRVADRFHISEENKQRLREILPWWRGNTISDQALLGSETGLDMSINGA
ncbi:MAG TPA: pyruvate formate lyase family protein [Spirochaetia bacterium]|nr:pyruvate formate lyase family protein [Spirochaetia bacterium]